MSCGVGIEVIERKFDEADEADGWVLLTSSLMIGCQPIYLACQIINSESAQESRVPLS